LAVRQEVAGTAKPKEEESLRGFLKNRRGRPTQVECIRLLRGKNLDLKEGKNRGKNSERTKQRPLGGRNRAVTRQGESGRGNNPQHRAALVFLKTESLSRTKKNPTCFENHPVHARGGKGTPESNPSSLNAKEKEEGGDGRH